MIHGEQETQGEEQKSPIFMTKDPLELKWEIEHDEKMKRFSVIFPKTLDEWTLVEDPPKYLKIKVDNQHALLQSEKSLGEGNTLLVSPESGFPNRETVEELSSVREFEFRFYRASQTPNRKFAMIGGTLVLLGLLFGATGDIGDTLYLRVEDVVFWDLASYVCTGVGAIITLLGAVLLEN